MKLIDSIKKLEIYCYQEGYLGWDPYDGMNSKIFQLIPLKRWDVFRLIWIQFFKISPINFRSIFLVPKQFNSKGLALLILGYCNIIKTDNFGEHYSLSKNDILDRIKKLSSILIKNRCSGYSGSCWGYNFDWQARRLFLFPKNTPTVVATAFCVEALIEAYEVTKEKYFLETALTSSKFIINDLRKIKIKKGLILSYSPISGNNTVFNASLLGAKTLSLCYHYTKNNKYAKYAKKIVRAACDFQEPDGSWKYGLLKVQSWKDSFHTGYNIECINTYSKLCDDHSFDKNIKKGLDFYLNNFFENDGFPKYYHNKSFPVDIHCPAQLLVTLSKLNLIEEYKELAEKVLIWTIKNMQSSKGFFYFQKHRYFTNKISYMRWSNAYMLNAMTLFYKKQNFSVDATY